MALSPRLPASAARNFLAMIAVAGHDPCRLPDASAPLRPIGPGPVVTSRPSRSKGRAHKVALIVPLTGADGGGRHCRSPMRPASRWSTAAIARSALVTYDSAASGAAAAANRAIADGAELILGPLLAEDVRAASSGRAARRRAGRRLFQRQQGRGKRRLHPRISPRTSGDRPCRVACPRARGRGSVRRARARAAFTASARRRRCLRSVRECGGRMAVARDRSTARPPRLRAAAMSLGNRGPISTRC